VVIFTPGFGALPSDYTALAEELASYGYVVASPANTYSGMTVVFPDGHVASEIAEQPDNDRLAHIWAEDVASVLKRLRELDADPASLFFRKLELTRIGVMGHSFGGVAAAQFCMAEPACAAGMDLDGALAGDAPKRGIRAPFVFMVSDGTTSYWSSKAAKAEWDSLYAKYLASVRATCAISPQCTVEVEQGFRHANFTDSAALFRPPLVWAHPALGSADPRQGVARVRQQVRSFLDRYVKGF
jgi:dienelactone hydrolase